jgi:hypothetical protein
MAAETSLPVNGINTFNEKPLHAALKVWYAGPDDRPEVRVDGYIIDLVRDDLLIEFQTRGFLALRRKLDRLTASHPVRLVFPIALEKWIVLYPEEGGETFTRRKSPRRGRVEQVFKELVYLPTLLQRANFSLEVLLIQEEEVRRVIAKRRFRSKGYTVQERRLLNVVERRLFETPADLLTLLPDGIQQPFTTRELAKAARQPVWLAQKMAYCLREIGVLEQAGKRGRAYLYTVCQQE